MNRNAVNEATPRGEYNARDFQRDGAQERGRRRDDLLAAMRVWLLVASVTLVLMLEDDAAMMACIFC